MSRNRNTIPFSLLLSLCLFSATTLLAAISPQYQEWGKGPVQWIMTKEEARAWKKVKSDADAIHFIDLFWARRDPTPGTPRNEYFESYSQRVVYSDQNFADPGVRGAMSDRGRVFIVLGPPPNMKDFARGSSVQGGNLELDPSGGTSGHDLGYKLDWLWPHPDAQKWGLPQVEVVFMKEPEKEGIHRDPSRPDFFGAAPKAIQMSIVSPGLTEVPVWALQGGLDPHATIHVPIAELPTAESVVSSTTTTVVLPAARPTLPSGVAPGTSHLVLLRDISTISTETTTDPFDKIVPVDLFHPGETVGWAVRYCDVTTADVTLGFHIHLTGQDGARKVDRSTTPDHMMPDALRSVPGCYVLRGEIPLAAISASHGTYELQLTVDNPATGKKDVLSKGFRVE